MIAIIKGRQPFMPNELNFLHVQNEEKSLPWISSFKISFFVVVTPTMPIDLSLPLLLPKPNSKLLLALSPDQLIKIKISKTLPVYPFQIPFKNYKVNK